MNLNEYIEIEAKIQQNALKLEDLPEPVRAEYEHMQEQVKHMAGKMNASIQEYAEGLKEMLKPFRRKEIQYGLKVWDKLKPYLSKEDIDSLDKLGINILQIGAAAADSLKRSGKKSIEEWDNTEWINLKKALLTQPLPIIKGIEGFHRLSQNAATNKLTHGMQKKPEQKNMYGTGIIQEKGFRIYIKDYENLTHAISLSTVKLLDFLIIKLTETEQYNSLVIIPFREYMQARGLADEKEARSQIKKDLNLLTMISFDYNDPRLGGSLLIHIYGGTHAPEPGITNSNIVFKFNDDFIKILQQQFMLLPEEAFQFNDNKNRHSYYFIRKISEHKRINAGKKQENIIGVHTLLRASPITPNIQDIKPKYIRQQIIQPFERDMNALAEAIPSFSWRYRNTPTTYEEFINAKIIIKWGRYPSLKTLINKRDKYNKQPVKELGG